MKRHKDLQELADGIHELIDKFRYSKTTHSYSEAVGVIEIVKAELLAELLGNDMQEEGTN